MTTIIAHCRIKHSVGCPEKLEKLERKFIWIVALFESRSLEKWS